MSESRLPPIIAESAAMQNAVRLARQFAPGNLSILLLAPTGCGKEVLAQGIHRWSGRGGEPVDINCAALPEQLVESELFGHDAQAYTGARRPKPGLIEAASGRTLFLDEVASLPLGLQAKLLRVLDTREVRRVGETDKRRVNFRLVSAAQQDLPDRIANGSFRPDLYQRLAGVVITIPPLADRPEDIGPLARHFAGLQGRVLEPCAEGILKAYRWPGNVRELQHVMERAGLLSQDRTVHATAVREALLLGGDCEAAWLAGDEPGRSALSREAVVALLQRADWDVVRAASWLGMGRTTFFRKLKELGVSVRVARQRAKRPEFTPFTPF